MLLLKLAGYQVNNKGEGKMADDREDDINSAGEEGSAPPPSGTKIKQTKPPLLLTTTVKRDIDLEKGWEKER